MDEVRHKFRLSQQQNAMYSTPLTQTPVPNDREIAFNNAYPIVQNNNNMNNTSSTSNNNSNVNNTNFNSYYSNYSTGPNNSNNLNSSNNNGFPLNNFSSSNNNSNPPTPVLSLNRSLSGYNNLLTSGVTTINNNNNNNNNISNTNVHDLNNAATIIGLANQVTAVANSPDFLNRQYSLNDNFNFPVPTQFPSAPTPVNNISMNNGIIDRDFLLRDNSGNNNQLFDEDNGINNNNNNNSTYNSFSNNSNHNVSNLDAISGVLDLVTDTPRRKLTRSTSKLLNNIINANNNNNIINTNNAITPDNNHNNASSSTKSSGRNTKTQVTMANPVTASVAAPLAAVSKSNNPESISTTATATGRSTVSKPSVPSAFPKKLNSACHLCDHAAQRPHRQKIAQLIACCTDTCRKVFCSRPSCARKLNPVDSEGNPIEIVPVDLFIAWRTRVEEGSVPQFICPHCSDEPTCPGPQCQRRAKKRQEKLVKQQEKLSRPRLGQQQQQQQQQQQILINNNNSINNDDESVDSGVNNYSSSSTNTNHVNKRARTVTTEDNHNDNNSTHNLDEELVLSLSSSPTARTRSQRAHLHVKTDGLDLAQENIKILDPLALDNSLEINHVSTRTTKQNSDLNSNNKRTRQQQQVKTESGIENNNDVSMVDISNSNNNLNNVTLNSAASPVLPALPASVAVTPAVGQSNSAFSSFKSNLYNSSPTLDNPTGLTLTNNRMFPNGNIVNNNNNNNSNSNSNNINHNNTNPNSVNTQLSNAQNRLNELQSQLLLAQNTKNNTIIRPLQVQIQKQYELVASLSSEDPRVHNTSNSTVSTISHAISHHIPLPSNLTSNASVASNISTLSKTNTVASISSSNTNIHSQQTQFSQHPSTLSSTNSTVSNNFSALLSPPYQHKTFFSPTASTVQLGPFTSNNSSNTHNNSTRITSLPSPIITNNLHSFNTNNNNVNNGTNSPMPMTTDILQPSLSSPLPSPLASPIPLLGNNSNYYSIPNTLRGISDYIGSLSTTNGGSNSNNTSANINNSLNNSRITPPSSTVEEPWRLTPNNLNSSTHVGSSDNSWLYATGNNSNNPNPGKKGKFDSRDSTFE